MSDHFTMTPPPINGYHLSFYVAVRDRLVRRTQLIAFAEHLLDL